MSKVIAITGSSGFIGTFLTAKLNDEKFKVLEISRQKNKDICNWDEVKEIENFDVIIHLTAKSFVPDSFNDPRSFYSVNLNSTLNVLELARQNKAKVIFLSSYLYGAPQQLPVPEEHPLQPHNPYAQTKILCEEMCRGYFRDFNIPLTIFRPFNIYGPGQKEPFLIPTIIEQAKNGSIKLKDPRPKRDYIHISDVVDAICNAVKADLDGFHTFNLGTGKSYSVEEIVTTVKKYSKMKIKVEYLDEYRKGEVLDTIADISKAKDILNWKPKIDIQEGIEQLLKEV